MNRYFCIHGHFYQPPRENAWLGSVERQETAYPYHDWNERILQECYAPNAAARILDDRGRTVEIINNYSKISFNFGPTLLRWMERAAPEIYSAIQAADRHSREVFSGHGSALAQAYNHTILPLANNYQKEIQIAWGVRDFQHRFGRKPEGMWLPETAVDLATLEVLAKQGISFTILAPHQATRVRPPDLSRWIEVPNGVIDTRRAYRIRLPSGASSSLFFYDGPTSRAVAFGSLLANGQNLIECLLNRFSEDPEPQLVHLATDGETYGHHHRWGEMALAYALSRIETRADVRLTNYGEFLARHPACWEVQIHENSSWSCAHGTERWRSDCGCSSGARPEWHQQWRAPFREALDWLWQELESGYEEAAIELVPAPRRAFKHYIEVVLNPTSKRVAGFLHRQTKNHLSSHQRIRLFKLLEMLRHAALMHTSCAWFFDDISGIEPRQALQYAGRAVELAREALGREDLGKVFLARLEQVPSNLPNQNGASVYRETLRRSRVQLDANPAPLVPFEHSRRSHPMGNDRIQVPSGSGTCSSD